MDHDRLHARARRRGVNPLVYRLSRVVLEPAFLAYFGLRRAGRGHLPPAGPVILASNHRSFLDPFVIGTAASRPIYYVAKEELFRFPPAGWWLNALGAFPVRRGAGDADTLETARAILARGDVVLLFCEGTRVRPGPLGRPRRGVGRLALESGAPVVPVAVLGTEAVRDGWRIRPHRVRVRLGPAVRFPRVADADRALSTAVTEHVWARVRLQWEWLGGEPPLRRAAVLGGGRAAAAAALHELRARVVDLRARLGVLGEALGLAHELASLWGAGELGELGSESGHARTVPGARKCTIRSGRSAGAARSRAPRRPRGRPARP